MDSPYALEKSNYTWKNALLWGNFVGHVKEMRKGSLGHRTVHALIALAELFPGVSQVASVCEKLIVGNANKTPPPASVHPRRVSVTLPISLGQPIAYPPTNQLPANPVVLSTKQEAPSVIPFQPLTRSSALKDFKVSEEVRSAYRHIQSNKLVSLPEGIKNRADFLKDNKWPLQPVIISKSDFVPKRMTEHLMRHKKNSALGVKYVQGDKITNMEGALHTFITPISIVTMTGDHVFKGGHGKKLLDKGQGRQVILSGAIQPDFESNDVIMKIVEVTQKPITGQPRYTDFQPFTQRTDGGSILEDYEEALQKMMIHQLTHENQLPGLKDVQGKVINYPESINLIEELIQNSKSQSNFNQSLLNKFVDLNGHVISLEVLFNLYLHQVRNEFSVLEQMLPQGYVYTIDPPVIFAKQIGTNHVNLLNRLQILAFKQLKKNTSFENLKIIGFNDFSDKGAIELLKVVFGDKIVPKQTLFQDDGRYSVKENYALVLHNNSDAFGQNIETEGATSMDGVIGFFSDASCQIARDRDDLLAFIV